MMIKIYLTSCFFGIPEPGECVSISEKVFSRTVVSSAVPVPAAFFLHVQYFFYK